MTLSRRRFVQGAGLASLGLLACCGPLPGQAQRSPTAVRLYRLGHLSQASPAAAASNLDLFRVALGEFGYAEGHNLVIEYVWGNGTDASLFDAAERLARLPVDVLVMNGGLAARMARVMTLPVPIVLTGGNDPISAGLAVSYAQPGGNVTGVTDFAGSLFGKRLQLLTEAAPAIGNVAIFWDVGALGPFPAAERGPEAQALGIQLHPLEPRGPDELDAAFEAAARQDVRGIFVPASPLASQHRERIVQLAARYRWPSIYFERQFVEVGGLMFYAASQADTWRRVAVYVDKIFKGARPAELPIEQSMTFDLVINLSTAQALGLIIPQHVLLQATEFIS